MSTPRRLRIHALIDNVGAGGAEMLLAEFAGRAPAAGIDLTVGHLKTTHGHLAGDRLRRHGIAPQFVPVASMVGVQSVLRVRRHLAGVAPDLVHTHLGSSDCLGAVAARSLGLPVVSTLHAADWTAESPRAQARLRVAALARRHCADRIVAVSEAAKAAYVATGWDVPEHLAVIHNGVGERPVPGAGAAVREELGIPPSAPVVAMVGSLRPEKAHEIALAAVPALRERVPDARLLIAGDGPSRASLEPLIRAAGDAVVMAGHREDVMAVLDAADVLLHTSRTEAFPTVLLEAMAASVPVVATAVGGTPEIVRHGESGLLLGPPVDPARVAAVLGRVLDDQPLRRALAASGLERFQRCFTLDRWVRATRAFYDGVIAAHRARPPAVAALASRLPGSAPRRPEPDAW